MAPVLRIEASPPFNPAPGLTRAEPDHPEAEAVLAGVATWGDVPGACAELGALDRAPVAYLFDQLNKGIDRSTPAGATVQLTLQRVSTAALTDYLSAQLESGISEPRVQAALMVLGDRSEPGELQWLIRLADEPLAPENRPIRARVVEEALARRLRAHESDFGLLPERLQGTSEKLAGPAVRALASLASPASGQALSDLLGTWPAADAFVLHALEQVVNSAGRLDSLSLADVREYLDSGQPEQVGLACRVLATCRDEDSLDDWVRLLTNPSPSVREEAHRALRSIAGLPLGIRPSAWNTWLDEEQTWWRTQSAATRHSLEHGNATEAVAAVREICLKRTRSEELCDLLGLALDRPEVGIAQLAARGLAAQSSLRAEDWLVQALERPRSEVRSVALESLRRRTGLELGPEPTQWRRALFSLER